MKILLSILIVLGLCACKSDKEILLEKSFEHAGANKGELMALLNELKHDSLAYEAGLFLIRNMTGNYSVSSDQIAKLKPYYEEHAAISTQFDWEKGEVWGKQVDSLQEVLFRKQSIGAIQNIQEDIKCLDASFLLDEINLGFEAWRGNAYSKDIAFEEFCEYILPYRRKNGLLCDSARLVLGELHKGFFDTKDKPLEEKVDSLLSMYRDLKHNDFYGSRIPLYSAFDFMNVKRGLCEHRCWFNSLLLSAVGMPGVIDFVPHWGNRNGGHSWNALVMNNEVYPFEPFWDEDRWKYKTIYNNKSEDVWWGKFRLPKVFRYTYSTNLDNPFLAEDIKLQDIPPLFRSTKYKDVSREYFDVYNVEVDLTEAKPHGAKFAYLAVWNKHVWTPVQWGRISGDKAYFEGMGADVLYMPVYYVNNSIVIAGEPCLLNGDGAKYMFSAQAGQTTSLCVNKVTGYFTVDEKKQGLGDLIGAVWIGYKEEAIAPDTLGFIAEDAGMWYNEVILPSAVDYKKLRLVLPTDTIALSEVALYDMQNERIKRNNLTISADNVKQNIQNSMEEIVDGRSASCFKGVLDSGKRYVDFDLKNNNKLSKIVFTPYCVHSLYQGNTYELFYWSNGWNRVDKVVGGNNYHIFDAVPQNALYLLKNNNWEPRGAERPFFYQDGFIKWL